MLQVCRLLVCLWLGLSCGALDALAETKTLKVGFASWPPFFIKNADDSVAGVNAEILHAALAPQGYEIVFQELPWSRSLRGVLTGTLDVVTSATKTPERENFAYFSNSYYRERFELYVLAENGQLFADQSLEELMKRGFRLGIFRGSAYGGIIAPVLTEPTFQAQISEQDDEESNYRMLLSGRIDGFIEESSEYAYRLPNASRDEHIVSLLALDEVLQHIMFSKLSTSPQVVADFNRGLTRIVSSGEYRQIFTRYNANAWMLDNH